MVPFLAALVLGAPASGHRQLASYPVWCNSYTCWASTCATSPACMAIDDGTHCESWCNAYTCDNAVCTGCSVCGGSDFGTPGPTPTIPGVAAGKVVLGISPDYPPYTSFTSTVPLQLGGFQADFMALMKPTCGIDVTPFLGTWSNCWTSKPASLYFPETTEYIGDYIREGILHGCSGYTHAKGERNWSLEFTSSILGGLKTAAILTRLVNGKPVVSPRQSDFSNVRVGDVSGWAPTPDTFGYNINYCTGEHISAPSDVSSAQAGDGNVAGINALLNGEFDALYLYSDQLYNFGNLANPSPEEQALLAGFGSTFAYIQTGLDQWSINGTTLAISKKGSGLKEALDPCIQKVVRTQEYTTMCEHYFNPGSCVQNEFSTGSVQSYFYDAKMNERTDSYTCSDGYCTCDELP